jgi:hypothetical protein
VLYGISRHAVRVRRERRRVGWKNNIQNLFHSPPSFPQLFLAIYSIGASSANFLALSLLLSYFFPAYSKYAIFATVIIHLKPFYLSFFHPATDTSGYMRISPTKSGFFLLNILFLCTTLPVFLYSPPLSVWLALFTIFCGTLLCAVCCGEDGEEEQVPA